MRIGFTLAWMFFTAVLFLALAVMLAKAWPLFLLFPAYGAVLLFNRQEPPVPDPLPGEPPHDPAPGPTTA